MIALTPADLYSIDGLKRIDESFLETVGRHCPELLERLTSARKVGSGDTELMVELAYLLEEFIAEMFCIQSEIERCKSAHGRFLELYKCKRNFVQRYAVKKYSTLESICSNIEDISHELAKIMNVRSLPIDDSVFARQVNIWMEDIERHKAQLDVAAKYAAYSVYKEKKSILFELPKKYDTENLIPVDAFLREDGMRITSAKQSTVKHRYGFNIAETPSFNAALNEALYCIICHKQNRDSCSKGMVDKNGDSKPSALGVPMTGCPLRVKISEINLLKSRGLVISPLAVITIDNPMCAMTGYRICNDCSRACIYQKQQPVDVPSVETQVLDCVLNLPYGFEIYSLFTRWNPLSFVSFLPKEFTGKNVLIVGLGPAGIGLSHYLLNEGHNVVAVDGLKIDPLPEELSGVTVNRDRTEFSLIQDAKVELFENLDDRFTYGFGGVAEYGITARWNKNYLKIARMLLERRENFCMHGSTRLGSNLSIIDAFNLGFHHVALATGAGAPRIPMVKNMLSKGVMTASSFLMALHLGNAPHAESITNLQIRFPAVVIGGGLTAVDAATELLAYYPVQVERFLSRYETISQSSDTILECIWTDEEREIVTEFIDHAREIRKEKELARAEHRRPNILKLLQEWGGVTIIYRGTFCLSTAYRLNSDELGGALSEGVYFAENLNLHEVVVDRYNSASGIIVTDACGEKKYIAAKSIIIATGTHNDSITLEECKAYGTDTASAFLTTEKVQVDENNFYISQEKNVSIFGDIHPYYKGSVVKALASAQKGYMSITKELERYPKCTNRKMFFSTINRALLSRVVSVVKLADKVVEITIQSPLAAANFLPGMFYRLQNLGVNSRPRLEMECVAVTGAYVDKKRGTIAVIVLDVGGSSRLCCQLQKGQLVSLMGPTGSPTHIPHKKNVLLIGGGVGNAVLFSIGEEMLARKCNVLFFAGFRSQSSVFGISRIEAASDIAIICCEYGAIPLNRPNDVFYQCNIIEALLTYGNDTKASVALSSIDKVIVVGSCGMMSAVHGAISGKLKHLFKPDVEVLASINSPMQCMMKEICGQCIQKHVDPCTGAESFVYSCVNQDQYTEKVDFDFLQNRLKQNSVFEKCTSKWVSCFLHEDTSCTDTNT